LSTITFTGLSQGIRIDHVITIVADLDSTVSTYQKLGFTLKQGRLHNNGLINAHIKFKNHTSFEIMSIKGEPKDEIARDYKELLKSGEGGVYLAITGISGDSMVVKLNGLGIEFNRIPGKSWDYITFSGNSILAHIFFIEYHINTTDSRETLTHKNLVERINSVWIEANDSVQYLFNGLGLMPVDNVNDSVLGEGQGYFTDSGEIILIPSKGQVKRPRIKMVIFGNENNSSGIPIRF
jgi:hypothetical protein